MMKSAWNAWKFIFFFMLTFVLGVFGVGIIVGLAQAMLGIS